MKRKVFGSIILAVATLVLSVPVVNAATGKNDTQAVAISELNSSELEQVALEISVSKTELENLNENLELAMSNLKNLNLDNFSRSNSVQVPVSENLYLEMTLEHKETLPLLRATYHRTVTSTLSLRNILGYTVVTLTGVGVFQTNGSTSRPIDAYGSYSGFLWSLSSKTASKGTTAYNAYVRIGFKGSFNVGISSINVTIQSFNKNTTIYCNAVGKYSAYWD